MLYKQKHYLLSKLITKEFLLAFLGIISITFLIPCEVSKESTISVYRVSLYLVFLYFCAVVPYHKKTIFYWSVDLSKKLMIFSTLLRLVKKAVLSEARIKSTVRNIVRRGWTHGVANTLSLWGGGKASRETTPTWKQIMKLRWRSRLPGQQWH